MVARDLENKRAWAKAARAKDPEVARAADRARYQRDKERIRERQNAYASEHRDEAKARTAAWYVEHKDDPDVKKRRAEYNERWKAENREKYLAARKRQYQARKADPARDEANLGDARSRALARRARYKVVAEKAKEAGCACGEREPICLDFHHRDPAQKVMSIGKHLTHFASVEALAAEIAKCDVICGNCHKKHHAALPPKPRNRRAETSARQRALRAEKWGHTIANAKRQGCTLCPEDDDACLEFHHVDPRQKSFKIGDYKVMLLKTDLWLEIQKTMVLCVNCHRRVHAGVAALPDTSLEVYWRARLTR